jgi:hypothetical protein
LWQNLQPDPCVSPGNLLPGLRCGVFWLTWAGRRRTAPWAWSRRITRSLRLEGVGQHQDFSQIQPPRSCPRPGRSWFSPPASQARLSPSGLCPAGRHSRAGASSVTWARKAEPPPAVVSIGLAGSCRRPSACRDPMRQRASAPVQSGNTAPCAVPVPGFLWQSSTCPRPGRRACVSDLLPAGGHGVVPISMQRFLPRLRTHGRVARPRTASGLSRTVSAAGACCPMASGCSPRPASFAPPHPSRRCLR